MKRAIAELITVCLMFVAVILIVLNSVHDRRNAEKRANAIEAKLDALASRTDADNADITKRLDAMDADIETLDNGSKEREKQINGIIQDMQDKIKKQVDYLDKKIEEVREAKEQKRQEQIKAGLVAPDTTDGEYLGTYELTAYIETGNPCADGVYPTINHTVACNDPNLWHKWIYIEGYGTYYVHDRGGMPTYNIIDVYVGDYGTAVQFGRRTANVYIVG